MAVLLLVFKSFYSFTYFTVVSVKAGVIWILTFFGTVGRCVITLLFVRGDKDREV